MKRLKVVPVAETLWTLDYDQLLDLVLDEALKPSQLVAAADAAPADQTRDFASALYGLLRAKTRQLTRGTSDVDRLTEWNEALVRLEAWTRKRGQRDVGIRFLTLIDLIEDEAALAAQQPLNELINRTHVREILLHILSKGGETRRAQVGSALKLSQPNLTRLLNIVQQHNLIERRRRGKEKLIALTERGRVAVLSLKDRATAGVAITRPAWTKGLEVALRPLRLECDMPQGAIDAQLLFAQHCGLAAPLGIEMMTSGLSRQGKPASSTPQSVHNEKGTGDRGFSGRISLNPSTLREKTSIDVFVTHAVDSPWVLDTGPAEDWTKRKAAVLLRHLRDHYAHNSVGSIEIIALERDAVRLLGAPSAKPSVSNVQVKYLKNASVERYFDGHRSRSPERPVYSFLICSEPKTADVLRWSLSKDIVLLTRPEHGSAVDVQLPKRSRSSSRLATLEIDIHPNDWLGHSNAMDAVSRFYRLGELLARALPERMDEYLKFLTELAKQKTLLGDRIAASFANSSEADLRRVLEASYRWWSLDSGGGDTLAGDLFAQLAAHETINGKAASNAVKQATVVRAHEESQVRAMWQKKDEISDRAQIMGCKAEFDGWFDECVRPAAELGLWSSVNVAVEEAARRMAV